ncbi:hypothetical protein AGDE_00763 [Angomonas deanei]|uniref:PSP1 C-terminal conserved region containing protein, putative n=1 Tax=Angomonas deanei TaxID=59799 RepID=A0A7G2CED0_9TRYP|nr:hypothetical protein AGDE_00763 [Angomonas deanei]CAD2216522.1 PSP1 C-terminal conserved region containing protein, putative [Angomonas deanei]|eukprot:EPY43159.1 hypothetical protein AGDE_00763 [Angomonas deanei]
MFRHSPYALTGFTPADADTITRQVSISYSAGSTTSLRRASLQSGGLPAVSECSSASVSSTTLTPLHHYYISFKYGKKIFSSTLRLDPQERVVVEGDRGVDLGVVEGAAPYTEGAPKIIRPATFEDQKQDETRARKEAETLPRMQSLALDVGCLGKVVDVMMQLDEKKITVIICRETKDFVDFRRLQRAAFDAFRCRVWFSYLDEIEETMSTEVQKVQRRPERNNKGTFNQRQNRKLRSAQNAPAAPTAAPCH